MFCPMFTRQGLSSFCALAAALLIGACSSSDDPPAGGSSATGGSNGSATDAGPDEAPAVDDAAIGSEHDLRLRDAEYDRPPTAPAVVTGHAWTWNEIGLGAGDKGGARFGVNGFSAMAGGAGVDGPADAVGFIADKLHGDGEILGRIRALQMSDPRATAGVMIRADLAPGAPSVFLGILAESARGGRIVTRKTAGAAAEASTPDSQLRAGQYLRIRRAGNHFTFYRSADRLAWVRLGAVDVAMPADVSAGIAVSGGRAGAVTTAEIDQLRALEVDTASAGMGLDLEPLYLGVGARASVAGGNVTVATNGDVFVSTAELGTALLAPMSGAQTITARVDALGDGTTPKARLGLTFREGGPGRVSPLARHAMISVDGAGKVAFQKRDRLMNFEAGAAVMGLKLPLWLRLVRYDDPVAFRTRVRGLYSTDGTTFVPLDTIEIPLPDPMMVGIVATSGDQKIIAPLRCSGFSIAPTTTVIEAPPPGDAGSGDAGSGVLGTVDAGGGS
jgi:hypothetical protein